MASDGTISNHQSLTKRLKMNIFLAFSVDQKWLVIQIGFDCKDWGKSIWFTMEVKLISVARLGSLFWFWLPMLRWVWTLCLQGFFKYFRVEWVKSLKNAIFAMQTHWLKRNPFNYLKFLLIAILSFYKNGIAWFRLLIDFSSGFLSACI